MSPSRFPCLRAALLAPLLLLVACGDGSLHTAIDTAVPAPAAGAPDYWPTTDWQTATPESQGFAAGALATLADDAAAALPYYTSLLVIRNGWIVHESYHATTNESPSTVDTKRHVWSVTKSVTALTLARALTLGDLTGADLDATVGATYPAGIVATLPSGDPRRDISLRNVLQMRSGLAWNEAAWLGNIDKDPLLRAISGQVPACAADDDQLLCSILQAPVAYPHGTVWNYDTYDSMLASGFFSRLAGQPLNSYAAANLFPLLGSTAYAPTDWASSASYSFGGGLLHLRSRDLAKLGMLVLYDGRWDDTQVLAPEWLQLLLAAQGTGQVATFDGSGEPAGSVSTDIPYGLQWWRVTGPGLGGTASISARGKAGQMLHVFRDKGLIIVITCDSASDSGRDSEINAFLQASVLAKLAD